MNFNDILKLIGQGQEPVGDAQKVANVYNAAGTPNRNYNDAVTMPFPNSGMVRAEDETWVKPSFYQQPEPMEQRVTQVAEENKMNSLRSLISLLTGGVQ